VPDELSHIVRRVGFADICSSARTGAEPTDWYAINNEIWKNPGTNLKRTFEFTASEKQDAKKWLKDQLKKRLC
jgi:hypothetical protein